MPHRSPIKSLVRGTLVEVAVAAAIIASTAAPASAAPFQPFKNPPLAATTTAGAAFAHQVEYLLNHQYGRLYNTLHPTHQRIVTRERFLDCYARADVPEALIIKWKAIDSLRVRLAIPGTTRRVWMTAVTVRFKFREANSNQTGQLTQTAHLVLVAGRWRWILKRSSIAAFKRGSCPET